MVNRIILNETSYFGAGSISVIADEVAQRGYHHALLVTDKGLLGVGPVEKVEAVLKQALVPYTLYSDVKPNPTIANIQHGIAACKASGADFILAVGGGSAMDTAKAIGIVMTNPQFADIRSLEGVAPTKNPSMPLIAVPTTAGTASEVTINYVVTDPENRRKFVCVDPHDIPMLAIIDADMMASMPKSLAAATGMEEEKKVIAQPIAATSETKPADAPKVETKPADANKFGFHGNGQRRGGTEPHGSQSSTRPGDRKFGDHKGRPSERRGGRGGFRNGENEYEERVVDINRVSKTVQGGKHIRFAALVVIGDGKGRYSFADAKSGEVPDAIKKALEKARKELFVIHIAKGDTLSHVSFHFRKRFWANRQSNGEARTRVLWLGGTKTS